MRTEQRIDGERWPGRGVVLAGRYRLEQHLAVGSSAALWRAVDERLDRPVAAKILLPQHGRDTAATERFRREALAIATVRSPYVVRIFDVDRHASAPFLVMEYVDGPALSAFVGRRLDARLVAAIGYQAGAALAAVHEHGLVHRDVKPGNIVFETATGRAKLLDFGIIKDLRRRSGLSGPHELLATVRYAAPEQIDGEGVGPWSDVYSLGLVLWEACTGQPPFHGETPAEIAMARLHGELPPVSESRPGLPPALDRVIERATRRERDARYRDGSALAEALAGLCGPLPHRVTRDLIAAGGPASEAEPTTPRGPVAACPHACSHPGGGTIGGGDGGRG